MIPASWIAHGPYRLAQRPPPDALIKASRALLAHWKQASCADQRYAITVEVAGIMLAAQGYAVRDGIAADERAERALATLEYTLQIATRDLDILMAQADARAMSRRTSRSTTADGGASPLNDAVRAAAGPQLPPPDALSETCERVAHAFRRYLMRKFDWDRVVARHEREHAHLPPVLCNAMQKSGTHLLVQMLDAVAGFRAYGRKAYWHYLSRSTVDERRRSVLSDTSAQLRQCLPGEIYRGHIAHAPELASVLRDRGFAHLLIVRDPRDVLVSLCNWWKRHEEAEDYAPFLHFRTLGSDEKRFEFLIRGFAAGQNPGDVTPYPDIGTRFGEFLGWLDEPGCTVVRFETLMSIDQRRTELRRIAQALFPDADDLGAVIANLETGMDPKRSRTFRTGGTGGWRSAIPTTLHESLMQQVAPILARLGYQS